MSLTVGSGPFGQRPAGAFNFEPPRKDVLYVEESPRRVRGRRGGETVVDSRGVRFVHEAGRLPVWYFPEADVREGLLSPSGRTERSPNKGEARFLAIDGDEVAWSFHDIPRDADALRGLVAFDWDAMDEWLEEDEPVIGHARDPYHRIDVRNTSRRVSVSVNGETVAESDRTRVLFEASLPPRFYFPREDVRPELLEPSDFTTVCAYKGTASYLSVRAGGELDDNLVWFYPEPLHDALGVRDRLAFFNERVDLALDGEPQERPITQWSRR